VYYVKYVGGGLLAAYCNDKWLVVASNGVPNHPATGLLSIPVPPGGSDGPYASSCVTRGYQQQLNYFKIPLNPKILESSNISNNLNNFIGQVDPVGMGSLGLPDSGGVAVTVSGQPIFPLFNNRVLNSYEECEIDNCGAHSGKAFDYHYHGDPFDPLSGKCMYSSAVYSLNSQAHPPLIGWSFDGLDIYGRYLNTNSIGYSTPLDVCGGHIHNDVNGNVMMYHYHGQVLNGTAGVANVMGASAVGKPYQFNVGGVYKCWRGDISVSNFFNNGGNFNTRSDFDDLKPCCNGTEYYTATGFTLSVISPSPSASPVGAPGVPGVPGTAPPAPGK
jgi:hypothetical protein